MTIPDAPLIGTVEVKNAPSEPALQVAGSLTPIGIVDTQDAADGTPGDPPPDLAIQVAGTDGTDLRVLSTDDMGVLNVNADITVSGVLDTQDAADGTPGDVPPTLAIQIAGWDGTDLRVIMVDSVGRIILDNTTVLNTADQADGAPGSGAPGTAIQVAGVDPLGNLQPLSTDTAGVLNVNSSFPGSINTQDAADGTPTDPVPALAIQVAGTDGTNLQTLSTDSTGNVNVNASQSGGWTLIAINPNGSPIPTTSILVGGSDGTDLRPLSTDSTGKLNTNVSFPSSIAVTQSGSWTVAATQSGTWTVSATVTGTVAATQSGSWTVASTQSGSWTVAITGTVTVSGTVAATQSGSWTVAATQSGSWTVAVTGTVGVTQSGSWTVAATQSGTWTVSATVSGTVAATQSGSWTVASTQSGSWTVAITGTVGVTQSGSWTVAATQSGSWTVSATVSGTVAATQSGSWTVAATQSGSWTVAITGTVTVTGTVSVTQSTSPWVTKDQSDGTTGSTAPTIAGLKGVVGGDGNLHPAQSDTIGNQYVLPIGGTKNANASFNGSTPVTLIVAPAAGKSYRLHSASLNLPASAPTSTGCRIVGATTGFVYAAFDSTLPPFTVALNGLIATEGLNLVANNASITSGLHLFYDLINTPTVGP